jgi:catalase
MSPSESPPPTTTDFGISVASQEHSLTIDPSGPILLQDFYLIEQMANFNGNVYLSANPMRRAVVPSARSP